MALRFSTRSPRLFRFLVTLVVLLWIVPALVSPAVAQTTYFVNITTDELDGSCSGDCSLRDAIALAGNNDAIYFAPSVDGGTITLDGATLGQLYINRIITIDGTQGLSQGVTIDCNNSTRFMEVDVSTTPVVLSGLTVQNCGGTAPLGSGMATDGFGGAVAHSTGALTVRSMTFRDNSAEFGGGAIFSTAGTTLTIENSTFSGNSTDGHSGALFSQGSAGTTTIRNSTFAGNTAAYSTGEALLNSKVNFSMYNTIVADNSPIDCSNTSGSFTGSNNLIEANDPSSPCGIPAVTDDPQLEALADNGGWTPTRLLATSSPAVDAGDNSTCLSTDQRGTARPQNGTCDIGAVELTTDELPVELAAFDGVVDGRDVALTWQTVSETNNAGFEVQRKQDDAFTSVGFVEGHGTTLAPQTYRFSLADLEPGSHVFRLKQVDFDGTATYIPGVEVTVGMPTAYLVTQAYPNPFNPQTHLSLSVAAAQHVTVEVFDMLGRRVATLHDGAMEANQSTTFTFEAQGLSSGTYLIQVRGPGFSESQPVLLVK